MKTEDLFNIYILHIRSGTEYCSTVFHNSLTTEQDNKLESIQKVALKVTLGQGYTSYEEALSKTGLVSLNKRRKDRCLRYALKATKHPENKLMFPLNVVEALKSLEKERSFTSILHTRRPTEGLPYLHSREFSITTRTRTTV